MIDFKKLFGVLAVSTLVGIIPVYADDGRDDDVDDDDYRPRQTQVTKNRQDTKATRTHMISRQKAVQIARSRVKNSRVVSVDFDRNDDGHGAVYDVELRNNRGQQWDVKIKATTGKVIYVKRDYED